MLTSEQRHAQTVQQLRELDHGTAIEVAETLCSLVPYSSITLQNMKGSSVPKDFQPNGAHGFTKFYTNGSTLFVYNTLPL